MASTGAQLVAVSRKYRNGDATWDDVMAAAKKHKPTYDAAEVSDNIYEDDKHSHYFSLKDFFILRLSKKKQILRDYFNQ
ncbi:MAG: hypothetical protein CM15mV141_080 [uncultured marine virus]|nr:MAG: hypothetical protein CM15mV141_080 [uncultured marine virus]